MWRGILMTGKYFRHTFIILLIASVILFSAGCESSSGSSSPENTVSENYNAAHDQTQAVQNSSDYNPAENIELSNYLLVNIDMAHDDLGGNRYDTPDAKTYAISEPGDIFITYANRADEGMYVLNIYMGYSGDYRAGNSAYSLFGCKLGDTSTDVHYKLMDYGFQTVSSSGGWEYLKIYDGEWTLSYKCDNGFLSTMEVNCQKRTMKQALESELKSGYYVAVLTGHSTENAYIEKVFVGDNTASLAFRGVFEEGSSEYSDRHMTEYMTFTVFPDENTVYVGSDESGLFYYSEEEFINIITSYNGLGLALTVDNGTLVKAQLMS